MAVFGQSGCTQAKVVVFAQKWLDSGKVVVKCNYSGKNGSFRAKVVVLWQSWLFSGKSGCIRSKWLCSGKSGCIRSG